MSLRLRCIRNRSGRALKKNRIECVSFIVSLGTIALPNREHASAEISRYAVELRETTKGRHVLLIWGMPPKLQLSFTFVLR
jgi:hypothetical protein